MEVLVFKTNLNDVNRVQDVGTTLDVHPQISKWNVDLHDCDNILRIVADNIAGKEVEKLLLNAGYYCEELD
jgi:hypothetical protein